MTKHKPKSCSAASELWGKESFIKRKRALHPGDILSMDLRVAQRGSETKLNYSSLLAKC